MNALSQVLQNKAKFFGNTSVPVLTIYKRYTTVK